MIFQHFYIFFDSHCEPQCGGPKQMNTLIVKAYKKSVNKMIQWNGHFLIEIQIKTNPVCHDLCQIGYCVMPNSLLSMIMWRNHESAELCPSFEFLWCQCQGPEEISRQNDSAEFTHHQTFALLLLFSHFGKKSIFLSFIKNTEGGRLDEPGIDFRPVYIFCRIEKRSIWIFCFFIATNLW